MRPNKQLPSFVLRRRRNWNGYLPEPGVTGRAQEEE
jgi:hypothetical protein